MATIGDIEKLLEDINLNVTDYYGREWNLLDGWKLKSGEETDYPTWVIEGFGDEWDNAVENDTTNQLEIPLHIFKMLTSLIITRCDAAINKFEMVKQDISKITMD
jgi:hypothetical protein